MNLSAQQLSDYREQGYLVIESLFTKAEVAAACAAISRIIAGKLVELDIERARQKEFDALPAETRELAVRKIMRFTSVDATLKALCEHPALVGPVEQLVGEKVNMIQDMALLKPPHIGIEKPWHQDNAYFLYEPPERVIGAWIALDNATPANGCMRVIPGTHHAGPVPHQHIRDCQIPDENVAADQAVAVPLAPGGALLFSAFLHHGTPTNNSPDRRRALQFHYAGKSCVKKTVEDQAKRFRDGSRYVGCAVWPKEESEKYVVS